ncbi:winged helix DNA-binding domain-containing protein [Geodermatophilus poikilotrophus]|uniref:winged helix DNA-binding domain-containing protein n=1 Tax=Geodermatophilus poikilotrophus TaxID=1333667 RepID=UPI001FE23D77|nr:winged helix DNA-binding domain-containing protein [Geodermatophilus poikilotrophus]
MTRGQVLAFRVRGQQLDREAGTPDDTAVLDIGVQDTGPDGGRWALALRGVPTPADDQLATAWTIRGAPHLYRRADLPGVAAATAPFSDADAGKRIYDAAKPLAAAGIGNLEGLDAVAATMRSVVTAPMVKGEVSGRLTELLPEPHLRFCRPCDARHVHEMPFRLAALRAGLELEPGTSPPVLRPVPGLVPADTVPPHLDVVRGYLRLLGPATPKLVAGYLDAPVGDVRARWPEDAVEVAVDGERRWLLAEDAARIGDVPPATGVLLLGPFDLFLQARDRPLLVDDPVRAKALWPVLGRPGAVLADGEVAGTWRPRKTGATLTVAVQLWTPLPREVVTAAAERLAAFRGVVLKDVHID